MIETSCGHDKPDSRIAASAPNAIVDPKALRRELALIRARNYALDDEESEIGLRSIAATTFPE